MLLTRSACDAGVFVMGAVVLPPSREGALCDGGLVAGTLKVVHPDESVPSRKGPSSDDERRGKFKMRGEGTTKGYDIRQLLLVGEACVHSSCYLCVNVLQIYT